MLNVCNEGVRGKAIGQITFLRTDSAEYSDVKVTFNSLEEMVLHCATPKENLLLEKIIIYSEHDAEPWAISLAFVSASKGKPDGYFLP
jgi:hypothetical protein